MTEYPLQLVRTREPPEFRPKRLLTELDAARIAKHLVLFRPEATALDALVAKARASIPGLTDTSVVHRMVARNPDCVWAIARKRRCESSPPVGEGFVAMLPLTAMGLRLLAVNKLDTHNPDPALITAPEERPAGIYVWATYAPGVLAAGVALMMHEMAAPHYAGVNFYSRPNTEIGRRFNENLGWKKGAKIGPVFAPHLYVYDRSPRVAPIYDSYHREAGDRQLSVTVARSFEDLARVISMRSTVYMAEQECPYEEEFDGNDLSATHLIGYVGDEPAGCLRIRFFAEFAKLERLAVRREFRHTRLSFQLVRAGIELCRVKGYHRLYGHAQKRLVNFWSRFGFRLFDGGHELIFSDFDYVEMVADIDKHPDAIKIGADPYVIIRPEGRWHMPGILERSAQRKVTRPSVAEQHS